MREKIYENFIVIGISHKTAPVKVREKFSFTSRQAEEALQKIRYSSFGEGAVILSTCNRSEIYIHAAADIARAGFEGLRPFILSIYGACAPGKESYFYAFRGMDALRHIFRVASGLDSQVLGEAQILGQVKIAWRFAYDRGLTNELLDRVFEKALRTGKSVRLETGISQGPTSIGSVAINMLEKKFKDLKERSVLIIGAGKIGALVSRYLKERDMRGIFVANRTYWRAQELAENCSGKAVDFFALPEELKRVDIIISSTSSPHVVLRKELIAEVMRARKRPLFIMDLALPRDVDPEAGQITGVSLCGLDDLKGVVDRNQKMKEREAGVAEKIVRRQLIGLCEEAEGRRTFITSPREAQQSLSV